MENELGSTDGGTSSPESKIFGDGPPSVEPISKELKPVTPLRRIVSWDPKTGNPLVTTEPMLTKPMIQDAISAAVSLPYYDPDNKEPEFKGLTNMEVMLIKRVRLAALTGDDKQVEGLLDRILGKAKQTVESLHVEATYSDFLEEVERREAPIEVKPSEPEKGIFDL